jgi:glutathione synthase/RimK-type ligase-like ATP-grasp enzyme
MTLKYIIITENPDLVCFEDGSALVTSPDSYIAGDKIKNKNQRNLKIINLCNSYEYLSKGYYCSLMADARGQRCIPSVDNIITLNWKRLSRNVIPELNEQLAKNYKVALGNEIAKTFVFMFGRCEDDSLEFLSRRLFDMLRIPMVSVEIKYAQGVWTIAAIKALPLKSIPAEKRAFFQEALEAYTGKAWINKKKPVSEKFWLSILHDPKEAMPPSNKGALEQFLQIAKRHNIFAELITRDDMPALLEYDALFIRETTAIDHHTYRFAYKAESEGIPVIDDTASIIRCSNKVFLNELLASKNIPMPKTQLIDAKSARRFEETINEPVILKVPDGSFSKGIVKVSTPQEYRQATQHLFKRSDILLMQEFLPSSYDWRIGVLNGEALYACRYYMAEGHWQIYNHSAKGNKKIGNHDCVALKDVPADVLKTAVKAASLVGNSLYGVDLKQNEQGVYIIEVNDNPNIDKGVEDQVEGQKIYDLILDHFTTLVNAA